MEYIHLVGVEQIQSAANTMKSAADDMRRSANIISQALEGHNRIMENFIVLMRDTKENIGGL